MGAGGVRATGLSAQRNRMRVQVCGTTGSGKTTLAREIAVRAGIRHIELDALYHGPDWQPVPKEQFYASIAQAIQDENWVLDGNYSAGRDLVAGRVQTVIFLDYSFILNGTRLIRRTLRRIRTQELCCNGNRESFRRQFLTRESILVWFLKSYFRRRRNLPETVLDWKSRGVEVIIVRHPREVPTALRRLSPSLEP